jgi:poly-gamma-glutamate capsule biosynthesis protein CapA/YwtB (metallophosphatase superfamily)
MFFASAPDAVVGSGSRLRRTTVIDTPPAITTPARPRPDTRPIGPVPGGPPVLTSRRVKRNRGIWGAGFLLLAALAALLLAGRSGRAPAGPSHARHPAKHAKAKVPPTGNPRLDPDWEGDGQAVTMAFGGDVHFPVGTTLGDRLAADPTTALGPTVPQLLAGANLSMTNFESALTNGTCPDTQSKQYVFYAPTSAVTAFQGAGISLITEANNHGEDCGPAGLQMALAARQESGYTILGIGQNAAQAFTPFLTTINGQHIAIIAATQVIDSDLQTAWTATATQPGLASAYDVNELIAAVERARKVADTVVVYLHWGTELDACPNPLQEPLAQLLVKAGADIIVGTHAHVLLGAGYLGSAYVDYGLGNFAFYDNSPPENASGSLVITVTGRHIDSATWRPAVIVDDLPQPLTGAAAASAMAAWQQDRSCTDATATPTAPLATTASETSPAPPAAVLPLTVDSD